MKRASDDWFTEHRISILLVKKYDANVKYNIGSAVGFDAIN